MAPNAPIKHLLLVYAHLVKHIIELLLQVVLAVAVLLIRALVPLLVVLKREYAVLKSLFAHHHGRFHIRDILIEAVVLGEL